MGGVARSDRDRRRGAAVGSGEGGGDDNGQAHCDEHMHRVHPLATDVIGGVRVQVGEQDLEVAKELLKEYVPLPEPPAAIE